MPTTPSDGNLKQFIKKQFSLNTGKKLFTKGGNYSLQFIQLSVSFFDRVQSLDKDSDNHSINLMIDYFTDETLQEFCRVNQYFSFNTESVNELKSIYTQLFEKIRVLEKTEVQHKLDDLSIEHNANLYHWLLRCNPFVKEMYTSNQEFVPPVACSEYAPDLQLNILQIELNKLIGPLLDVGCGLEMNLVNYLREKEIEAYGIDRFDIDNPYYEKRDWLEYDFGVEKWGSIISNLGFSNHFIHHNLRVDGNYREYAQKYMEILDSLKSGGSFYYAPDLPFIEKHLDRFKYQYTSFHIAGYKFKASKIIKIE